MTTITIEQLAKKLNGNFWQKDDLKRIYLRRGYNTKKMSTKTFVWQNKNGDFLVSCKIDCPSQSYNWIESQEDKVKESVEEDITEALAPIIYLIKNKEGNFVDFKTDACAINNCEPYYSKTSAKIDAEELHGDGCTVFEIDRKEFDLEVEKLDKIESEKPKEVTKPILVKVEKKVVTKKETVTLKVGATYNHSRFGDGVLISQDESKGLFDFAGEQKSLIIKFTKLTLVK